ncbi:MAG: hypothetical protein V4538_16405 [Bacteroidota bacterium]
MEQQLFKEIPDNEREAMLEANCLTTEEKDIQKYFSIDELTEMRATFLSNSIIVRKANEVLNKAKDENKAAVKAPLDQNEYLLKNIRLGFQEVTCQVYIFPDYENRMVGYYDNTGTLLESRRMRPEEAQAYIPQGK